MSERLPLTEGCWARVQLLPDCPGDLHCRETVARCTTRPRTDRASTASEATTRAHPGAGRECIPHPTVWGSGATSSPDEREVLPSGGHGCGRGCWSADQI